MNEDGHEEDEINCRPAVISLDDPHALQSALSPSFCQYCAHAAAYCLDHNEVATGAVLMVDGERDARIAVEWNPVTDEIKRTHADSQEATEFGAYAIAMGIVPRLTDLRVVERSRKGPGFDFWLGDKTSLDPLFQGKARLEVSGILKGGDSEIRRRVHEKLDQLTPSDGRLPGWVVVVEFGAPRSRMVKK